MSLNGLDDVKITEAYQSALTEAGGWFLLKYVSRDAVEVFKRGSGGVHEARGAIAEHEEKSPLYGFLIYRRRKVLVKYIPDGTSRLVQARVTVHFKSFEDKFRPHDTVIIIATATELTESALSAACSLHSAAETSRSSGSSTSQVRKSKLDEIVEDPKERPSYDARAASIDKPSAPLPSIPTIAETGPIDLRTKELPSLPDEHDRPATRDSYLSNPPPVASRKAAAILGIPMAAVSPVSLEASNQRPTSPNPAGGTASPFAASINSNTRDDFRADYLAYLDALDERSSTSTARPSLPELYAGMYQKPKIKLGPRPSADGAAKAAAGPRPTASLPPGLRAAPRKELHSANRPAMKQTSIDPIIRLPPPPPIPEVPLIPEMIRPSSSPASVKSMPTTLASQAGKKTPEKRRLQKAMEMRKKQMAAAKKRESVEAQPTTIVEEPVSSPVQQAVNSSPVEAKVEQEPTTKQVGPESGELAPEEAAAVEPPAPTSSQTVAPDPPPIDQQQADAKEVSTSELPNPPVPEETGDSLAPMSNNSEKTSTEDLTPVSIPPTVLPEPEPTPVAQDAAASQSEDQGPRKRDARSALDDLLAQEEDAHISKAKESNTDAPVAREKTTATATENLAEKVHVQSPARAPADHTKADSGVQIELDHAPAPVAEHQHLDGAVIEEKPAEEDRSNATLSPSPASVQPSSDLTSTRPSSVSETEEGTIADIWAKETSQSAEDVTPEQPVVEAQEKQEDSAPNVADVSTEAPSTSTSPSKEVPSPTSVKERAVDLQNATQAAPGAEQDEASDDTLTERSNLHSDDTPVVTPSANASSTRNRRRGMLSPITLEPVTPGTEESEFDMSDDDLMSELQNAEVQEAMPVAVMKGHSPVEAHFPRPFGSETPRSPSNASLTERRPSQPLLKVGIDHSPLGVSRSASSGQLSRMPGAEGITVAKAVNVSSGISQRIKALARNSGSSENVALDRVPSRDSTGKSIAALRKSSLGSGTTRPFVVAAAPPMPASARERVVSLARNSTVADTSNRSSQISTAATPRDSVHAVYNISQRTGRPESISVTARIVRDDRTQKPNLAIPNQPGPLELHESPLIIEHHHKRNASTPTVSRLQTPGVESSSSPVENGSPVSPSRDRSLKSPITPLPRTSSENWRSSFSLGRSRRTSDAKSPTPMVKSSSSASIGTTTTRDSDAISDKRSSISSRMLKRMSNSISLGRKTITQIVGPTVEEPSTPLPDRVSEERRPDTLYAMEIGDLNVQLPDTLLWKRRWLEIDNHGNLVVKMSKSNEMANTKNNCTVFHMTEFKRPFLPDHERQEMPYSVVIDFVDGRTMQCACETAGGQIEVLRQLQEAHQAYTRR